MALSGIATAEMVMADLGFPITLGVWRRRGAGLLSRHRAARLQKALRVSDERRDRRRISYIPTYEDVLAAHERIRPYIHRTPVLTSRFLDELTGASCSSSARTSRRPAPSRCAAPRTPSSACPRRRRAKGVATHSCGNHALSLSYAAGRRGIPCHVVMPRTAPQAKKDAVRGYGGIITECEPSTSCREAVFAAVQAETGADFVHPYNDPRVIAGQGTCSREMIEELGRLDAVVAPIGGGGMISGTCLTLSTIAPADEDLRRRAGAGRRRLPVVQGRAHHRRRRARDRGRRPEGAAQGAAPGTSSRRHVTDILTAGEEEIVDAMRLTWERMKIVIEPSARPCRWRPS